MIYSYIKLSMSKKSSHAMSQIEKRTITLPHEHAVFVDAKVSSGDYESASEVVRAGLQALQARDVAVERWLHAEVAPIYDRMKVEPHRAIAAAKVFAKLRKRGGASGPKVRATTTL
jgi:antitoxin ParD1/3/4